ncbi:MAG: DegT/DnrJ/EryC1/StrS family aminotransferase [Chloroflexota bacterium]|nr:DegT/DnrJ/EryC1/StrS family aminotransferase [Chloroflexota bacterium]
MRVPFVDLKAQYKNIKKEIDTAISRVIAETAFVRGQYVEQFEKLYAKAYGIPYCISCGNGTDAIYVALKALGIGKNDEVITTASSWISSSQTISQAGARVVFADIEPDFFTIDPVDIERKITNKTKAIIPVHIYGQPASMDKIMAIAEQYNLYVIEDCAQSHFATYKGKLVGTFGHVGTFSFYPGKNLGAYGDAGAIVSSDEDFSIRARMFANHGSIVKHQHEMEGINSRMDGIQAAVLSVKLKYIHEWNESRARHADWYNKMLATLPEITTPKLHSDRSHVFHLYVIRSKVRDVLQTKLKNAGIQTAIHYPVSLPLLNAYKYLGYTASDFPVSYQYQDEILSLPMYPEMTEEMRNFVLQEIHELFD